MSAKKWVTIVTFLCTILAIVLLPIFKCCKCDMGYDISLAIFGSALLGFIMSLAEYFTERRKAMEQFWTEARRVLVQFRKAKHIQFDEPEEIVVSCIAENYENKLVQECDPTIARFLGRVESHENQSKYIQWMEEHEVMSFSENDDIGEILDKIYVSRMESYEDLIKDVIENYIELSQISLSELDSAYGNLNFIFANKSIRLKAYDEIYDKIRTIRNKILMEAFHFNLWKEEKGNFVVCMNKAIDVSKTLFTVEKTKKNHFESVCIYQKQFDDVEESLESFRTKIYFKAKKQTIERIPVSGKMINFKEGK